jgi:hypothetical protein
MVLLKDICDGYIAPALVSPFHIGDIAHEEIVIFDPILKLHVIDTLEEPNLKNITEIIYTNNPIISINNKHIIDLRLIIGGANKPADKNSFFDKKNKKEIDKAIIDANK